MNTFYDFIYKLGYKPKSEIIPNKFIRLGRKNSVSAKLFADGLGGYLYDWRTGEKVAKRYDTSTKSIWRWAKEGTFPKPYKLTAGVTAWKNSELAQWERNQTNKGG